MSKLQVGEATEVGLVVNGREYSWLWLLDHSQDEPMYHAAGRQRLFETFVADGPSAADVTVDGDLMVLKWRDNITATYTAEYFGAVGRPNETYKSRRYQAVPWNASAAHERAVTISFDALVADGNRSDQALGQMLRSLGTEGFVLLADVPLDRSATGKVFERIGYVRKTLFGELWNLRSDGEYDDTGSTSLDISPHTDGTYSNDAPGFLGLHCLQYDAEGGENLLVDGFQLAATIRDADPQAFRTLSTVEIPGRYIGDGGHLIARRPLFRHDDEDLVQVSYNNHDRAPLWLPPEEMAELYRSLGVFDEAVRDPSNQFEVGLRPGSMLLFDNWRTLHGRKAFVGDRHLIGGYLNREDYESAIRRLAQEPLDLVE